VALTVSLLVERLGTFGLLQALIQRHPLTPAHESVGAIVYAVSGAGLATAVLAASPWAEAFMGMPGLAPVLQWHSGVLVAHGLGLVPESRLHRALAFDRLTGIQVGEKLIGGGTTIALAVSGYGAMALAWGMLAGTAFRLACLWACEPRGVPWVWSTQAFRDLFGYGAWSLVIGFTTALTLRLDVLIVGRYLGSGAVGLYHRAAHLASLPLSFLMQPVNKVLFPAMASVQGQEERLRRGYLSAARVASMAAFPCMVGVWGTAEVVVPLVYGEAWRASVPILQWLAVGGVFRVILTVNSVVLQSQGRVRSQALWNGAWLALVAAFGAAGAVFGPVGVAAGMGLATGLFMVALTALAWRVARVSAREWCSALCSGGLASVAMGLALWGTGAWLNGTVPPWGALPALITVGSVTYVVALCLCLTREDRQFLAVVRQSLPARVSRVVGVLFGDPARQQTAGGRSGLGEIPLVNAVSTACSRLSADGDCVMMTYRTIARTDDTDMYPGESTYLRTAMQHFDEWSLPELVSYLARWASRSASYRGSSGDTTACAASRRRPCTGISPPTASSAYGRGHGSSPY
jgi:O-antigen/teichoic acid export membrane protein